MLIGNFIRFIIKSIFKVLLLPVLLLVYTIKFTVNILFHIGSLGVTVIILLALYAIITGIMNHAWEQTFIMTLASVATIGLALGAGMIVVIVDNLTNRLSSFIFQ